MHKKTIIFWGTGSAGINMLDFWRTEGLSPDFFTSNDLNLWGKNIKGINVIPPSQINKLPNIEIYITCTAFDSVFSQLKEIGIDEKKIITAMYCSFPSHVKKQEILFQKIINRDYVINRKRVRGCYVDLSNGIVLGGVENWVYQLARKYNNQGIDGEILIPENSPYKNIDIPFIIKKIKKNSETSVFKSAYIYLLNGLYSTFISNFPNEIFLAACFAKKILKHKVKHVAVIHSDLEIYYIIYSGFIDDIDVCYVISTKIKNKLVQHGFPKNKIKLLFWIIDFEITNYNRIYNKDKIIIGYAGRLNHEQKRTELLPEIAKKLKESNVNFYFEIAGSGDQEEYIKLKILEYHLEENVKLVGVLEHNQIQKFWETKDIYLSCSDYEGHSISQCEAMACGVVPVVTDVSGVQDDIENGINGYVVELDNRVNKIANIIKQLSISKEKLKLISEYNIKFINQRNKESNSYLELI